MNKQEIFLISLLLALCPVLSAQTFMNIEDNTDIGSNSWIIFNPGTYNISDPGNDGLLRINNKENIILDGSDVIVDGTTYAGYMIKINNSKNIVIRNFESVSHFKYAVYITNSDSIEISGCDFSFNKVDSSGWINVWSDYQSALGGGVMMYQSSYADIFYNTMKMQNDGVALYHCDNIRVWQNDFDWNTSYGIRMFFTDSCHIHHNQASHINRPYTNPSDCAAILMIVSNVNLVDHNVFEYSGDGIFLGQYEYSEIPNQNVFLYNECSYSPHNAIEATFADGNIYKHNVCNYSHYGFWLGYSFNSLVDSNEIIGNQYSGIAIDRGYENVISHNIINENPVGIELWEGGTIPGYENQYSHDYRIMLNEIRGNRLAVKSSNTEHLIVTGNQFQYNQDGIQFNGSSTEDTLAGNLFRNSSLYHLENMSPSDIYAPNNIFFAPDQAFIECGIYDEDDNPSKGEILYQPYYYTFPLPEISTDQWEDMAEPPAQWYAYPEICGGYGDTVPTAVNWDYEDYKAGNASVHCVTGNGWDIGLQFWPGGDSIVHWQLSESDTLIFWLKTINTTGYGFQYHQIRVGNLCGGYYKYSGSVNVLNAANGTWKMIKVPLAGGGSPYNYVRTAVGTVTLDDISWVSIHADTWDFGFEIWLDGVHFSSFPTGIHDAARYQDNIFTIFPNPADNLIYIQISGCSSDRAEIEILDMTGKIVRKERISVLNTASIQYPLDVSGLPAGLYTIRGKTTDRSGFARFVVK